MSFSSNEGMEFAAGESSTEYEDNMATQPLPAGLSDVQEMVLALVPIPSAALSIFGSTCIIYMSLKSRNERLWTPYTRLLMGMSICDIISSMTLAVAAFMRPQESGRVWTFGSEATCSAVGLLTQFSYSGLFYNAMLSLYFLLSTRFRLKNDVITRRFEPIMHFLSLGFPIVTGVVGAVMGVYSTTTSELGCWVNDFPRGCIGEECLSITIGWYYFGMPFLISLAIIGLSNVIILHFVRKKTNSTILSQSRSGRSSAPVGDLGDSSRSLTSKPGNFNDPASATEGGSSLFLSSPTSIQDSNPQDGASSAPSLSFITSSFRRQSSWRTSKSVTDTTETDVQRQQMKRLRLVSSQALLFVASFILTAGWLGLLRIIESMAETPEDELRMVVRIYPLMVINAIMAPLQGFFNMLVFVRPKYLKWRNEFPMEKRLWVFKRCIFGNQQRPTIRYVRKPMEQEPNDGGENPSVRRKSRNTDDSQFHLEDVQEERAVDSTPDFYSPRSMVSTLTASVGDFDHVIPEGRPDERWQSASGRNRCNSLAISSRLHSSLASSLEVISELSVSHFEAHPSPPDSGEEVDDDGDDGDSGDDDDEESREDKVDIELSPMRPPLLKSRSNHSEDRWSASSPKPRELRKSKSNGSGDRWSTASPKSDRSPTLRRANPPRRTRHDGSITSDNRSDGNHSDGRWSSSFRSRLQGITREQLEMPRRLVSEQSEFCTEVGDSIAESVASPMTTESSESIDTPLQPPTRRMSPPKIIIPETPIL
ncbi:MAG: hypothetical protein SGBAC_007807 [Bacillariaceae sp.]